MSSTPATHAALPPWRGFNLHQMFALGGRWRELMPMGEHRVHEDDFRWLSEWGFDFVRVPMSYLLFIGDSSRRSLPEERLAIIDQVVELGRRYDVHVSLNLWRAPGHTNLGYPYNEPEPGTLWTEDGLGSLDLFVHLWRTLARRYRGISADRLSFDLVNEPPATRTLLSDADIMRVHETAARAVHEEDPGRLVLAEGLGWGFAPASAQWSRDARVAQSVHVTQPLALTHYRCEHVPEMFAVADEVPSWPLGPAAADAGADDATDDGGDRDPWVAERLAERGADRTVLWDRERLARSLRPWYDLVAQGVGVHAGEIGSYRRTPHAVALAYLRDVVEELDEHGIGFALWNLRGPFGVLDSGRDDVAYEDWHGHLLDREMLDILRKR
ncbi:glycoside hydrolase family 5 protein [Nonomuraea sp. NPDC003707]